MVKTKHSGNVDCHVLQEVKYIPDDVENIEIPQVEKQVHKTDTIFLQFTVIIGILVFMVGGTTLAWPSPAIVKLQSNDSEISPLGRSIKTIEISNMLGIPGMLSLIGTLLLPKLADLIGRKRSLQVMGVAMALSIVALAFSNSVNLMIVCLSVLEMAFCGTLGILPIYLTEICEDHNRAKYGCLMSAFLPIGQLYTFLIGPAFTYRTFTLLTAIPIIPFFIFFHFAPETPVYSLTSGNKKECLMALQKLRSNKTEQEIELDFKIVSESLTVKENKLGIKDLFSTKEGRVGIMLAVLPVIIQECSGVPTVITLIAPIFNESGSNLSGDTIAIIVGVVTIVCSIFTSLTVERIGKKPMLIISSVGTGVPVTLLGVFFYLKYINSPIIHQLEWVPVVCVVVYVLAYSLGLGSISITIMGELFPFDLRSTASALTMTVNILLMTIYMSGYPLAAEYFGTHWCMLMFGASCFIGAVLIYVALPETKGKSIAEVQEVLKNYSFCGICKSEK